MTTDIVTGAAFAVAFVLLAFVLVIPYYHQPRRLATVRRRWDGGNQAHRQTGALALLYAQMDRVDKMLDYIAATRQLSRRERLTFTITETWAVLRINLEMLFERARNADPAWLALLIGAGLLGYVIVYYIVGGWDT